jgi:hypothetical protein
VVLDALQATAFDALPGAQHLPAESLMWIWSDGVVENLPSPTTDARRVVGVEV